MIENVKGIVGPKNKDFFNNLLDILSSGGYRIKWKILNCYEYGIPQKRERVFVIGIRNDIRGVFYFPDKIEQSKRVNIKTAIQGLTEIPNGLNNHSGFGLRNDEKPFAHKIRPGENWKALPIEDQKAFMKKGFYSGGGRAGALYKVDFNNPSRTILSSPMGKATAQLVDYGNGTIRRFTVRESLRLQTAPDWFYFPDHIPLSKQYERCSGIPSLMAYKLFLNIADVLDGEFDFNKIEDFDNHIRLSIPNFDELIKDIKNIADYFIDSDTNVYDIGCSTGSMITSLSECHRANFIGIDKSDLIDNSEDKEGGNLIFVKNDFINIDISNSSFITCIFLFQFLSEKNKKELINKISKGLIKNGCLVVCEKIISATPFVENIKNSLYYQFKLDNFSEAEIIKKEQRLRSSLRLKNIRDLMSILRVIGEPELFWCRYNFVAFMVVKDK